MAAAITPKLDFRTISLHDGAEIRPYFVIGASNAHHPQIQPLANKIRNAGLEVLSIDHAYRKEFELAPDFQGIAIFIQKHLADDSDHSNNGHGAGFDILESFQKIQQLQLLPIEAHALTELQQLIVKVQGFQANMPEYLNYNPQLAGAEQTLNLMKNQQAPNPLPNAPKNQKNSTFQKAPLSASKAFLYDSLMAPGERAAAIRETEEHILTLTLLTDELPKGDPQKSMAKQELEKAQLKLAKLKNGS